MASSIETDASSTYWLADDGLSIKLQKKDGFGGVYGHTVIESDWSTTNTVWMALQDVFHAGQRKKMNEIKNVLEIRW